jgi:hypothetical protein
MPKIQRLIEKLSIIVSLSNSETKPKTFNNETWGKRG